MFISQGYHIDIVLKLCFRTIFNNDTYKKQGHKINIQPPITLFH